MLFEDLPRPLDIDLIATRYAPEDLAVATRMWTPAQRTALFNLCVDAANERHPHTKVEDTPVFNFICLLLLLVDGPLTKEQAHALVNSGWFYYHSGDPRKALILTKRLTGLLTDAKHNNELRRAYALHGLVSANLYDYDSAFSSFEKAIAIANKLNDRAAVASTTANALTVHLRLGLYRESMRMAATVYDRPETGQPWDTLKVNAAGNALFCAVRMKDWELASSLLDRFMHLAEEYGEYDHTYAMFCLCRVEYLLGIFDIEGAHKLATKLKNSPLATSTNERTRTNVRMAYAQACHAAGNTEEKQAALDELLALRAETAGSLMKSHDDVLRALIAIHETAQEGVDPDAGIKYAMELLQFQAKHSRASFYHQIEVTSSVDASETDLVQTFQAARSARDMEFSDPSTENPFSVEQNDELSSVHASLAKMRTKTLKSELRSKDFRIAEDYAIRAEMVEDPSGEHCYRVGYLSRALALEMGIDTDSAAHMELACRLHDIGKTAINDLIKSKPGPLTFAETRLMREHAEMGFEFLRSSTDSTLQAAALVARHHHERWDGSGYPSGLRTTAIPLTARICALAEVYDALTNARPWRAAFKHEDAVEMIKAGAGTQFDPEMVPPFLRVLEAYEPRLATIGILAMGDLQSSSMFRARDRFVEAVDRSAA
jgi:putative two-component system response regulator